MNLRKWLDDADIRANDSEYAANLKSALRYLLGLIEYEEKVIGWIAEWRQLDRRELAPTTSVTKGWSGLGVDGDDAKELIEFLRNRSGVSFEAFEYDRYFGPELSIAAAIFHPVASIRGLRGPLLTIRELASFMYQNRSRPLSDVEK